MLKTLATFFTTVYVVSAACPTIVTRDEWGARPPKDIQNMTLPVPNVVIHHTEMGECYTVEDCILVMRSIQNYHMDDNGWSDIGYSFLIGGDGTVFQGRGWDRVGAHAPNYNDKSIGISLIGSFMVQLPPAVEMQAARSMIECGIELGYISEEYLLYGHRDVTNTDCPGDALYEEISTWPHKPPTV